MIEGDGDVTGDDTLKGMADEIENPKVLDNDTVERIKKAMQELEDEFQRQSPYARLKVRTSVSTRTLSVTIEAIPPCPVRDEDKVNALLDRMVDAVSGAVMPFIGGGEE